MTLLGQGVARPNQGPMTCATGHAESSCRTDVDGESATASHGTPTLFILGPRWGLTMALSPTQPRPQPGRSVPSNDGTQRVAFAQVRVCNRLLRAGARMRKSELVAALNARHQELTHTDAERIINTVLDTIAKALAAGRRVELRGFGAFSVKQKHARLGRNPRTGEKVTIKPKRAPFFRTGKGMRKRLCRVINPSI
jgi:integration host factor subunit beta